MVVTNHHVVGYEDFCKTIENFDNQSNKQQIYIYFGGSKLPSGESWCDDCQRAWPVIQEALGKIEKDIEFIQVEVGDRDTWKDPQCAFRKDSRLRLMVVPTLVLWKSHKKLEGDQCENLELLDMLFDDEED